MNRSLIPLLILLACSPARAEPATSEWVHPGPDGKLAYKTTPTGDRIMDFSYAGYKGGGVALPNVSVKKSVKPSGGEDDTKLIQTALARPLFSATPLNAEAWERHTSRSAYETGPGQQGMSVGRRM